MSGRTQQELRRLVCDTARSYLGCREADGSHRPIIDRYNAIRPLPGVYAMGYGDPWCAAFVSAVGAQCGLSAVLLPHCNCDAMIALYQAAGRWEERDDAVPKAGDLVFYDWQDDGAGDCRGSADHVGIVTSVSGDLLRVVEGNLSDAVGERSLYAGARFIRGYARPDYASAADDSPSPASPSGDASPSPASSGGGGAAADGEGDGRTRGATLRLPVLSRGDSGETVRAAQLLLIGRGWRCGPCGADGQFGAGTYGAVLSCQRGRRLSADGVIGPATWSVLLGLPQ